MIEYLKALRACAVAAFNANQVTQHEHKWLRDAVERERRAFENLPRWVRALLGRMQD